MIHSVDPRQNRLFDPFDGVIPLVGRRIIAEGWQGLFRHVLLDVMPVRELGRHFSDALGAPTKELYSMAGLVFLADFFGWTAQEAIEAYIFRSDVQYALNLEPGAEVSTRTLERYQKLFREDDLAARVFEDVTTRLIKALDLDVSRQRLDSTHVFSHMASFGRTKLMAVAIKRFLTQLKRHAPDAYAALAEDLRRRYEPAQARLFADAKDAEARARCRQQAAEDLRFVIDRFADRGDLTNRSTYKALIVIFDQQCELSGGKVVVKTHTGGDCVQNPSDPDATYDGKKGPGYQVQITEPCAPGNDVQLITAGLPQTACASDAQAVTPMLDQLEKAGRLPEELLGDTLYTGDENVQAAAARGVDLIGPVPGRAPEADAEALTIDDFALDERTGTITACPAGHQPTSCSRKTETASTRIEMPASACAGCPFRKRCPIERTHNGKFTLEFTDKDQRLAGRRVEEKTDVFGERYAPRSGIESTNSGLKNRLDLGRLRVRGLKSVSRVVLHKLAGWNVLRASASEKLKSWVASRVAEALGTDDWGGSGSRFHRPERLAGRLVGNLCRVVESDRGPELMPAA
ncbi:MAG TPA: transposase [Thermomicrobiales bacterium]|nr:transposase [Thermomicrobiales bacterium]